MIVKMFDKNAVDSRVMELIFFFIDMSFGMIMFTPFV